MLNQLLRFLGLTALGEVARRLPLPISWAINAVLIVVSSLFPLWLVHTGRWSTKDLMLLFAVETFLVVFDVLVRILTYQSKRKGFAIIRYGPWMTGNGVLAWVYFFTIALMVPAMLIVTLYDLSQHHGLLGSTTSWLVSVALMLVGAAWSLGGQWFARGQRWVTTRIWPAVAIGSSKMVVVYVMLFALAREPKPELPTVVVVLVVLKVLVDLGVSVAELVARLRSGRG